MAFIVLSFADNYVKMNMTAHPTQNDVGVFEQPLYGQLYFLDPDEAVNGRVNGRVPST